MLKKHLEEVINQQIEKEAFSSQLYLAMASWAEINGYSGIATFLYNHADEERLHMLKFIRYVNNRGGCALISKINQPDQTFNSIKDIFEKIMEHEEMITESINNIVGVCLEEKDFTTHNFMQWFVTEQIEEENLFGGILDKIKLLGDEKPNLYMFDRDIMSMIPTATTTGA